MSSTTQGCGCCGRYGHTQAACNKKQDVEGRSKSGKYNTKDSFRTTVLKKEVQPEAAEKKTSNMFV